MAFVGRAASPKARHSASVMKGPFRTQNVLNGPFMTSGPDRPTGASRTR